MKKYWPVYALMLLTLMSSLQSCRMEEWQPPVEIVSNDTIEPTKAPCNGHPELCDKQYNEVTFATTRRSYRYEIGQLQFQFPNQDFPVNRQLRDGVSAIMLDVVDLDGDLKVFWGTEFLAGVLGSDDLSSVLGEIESYMSDSSRTVVSLLISTSVSGSRISDAISAAGLDTYLHTQSPTEDWPTLETMIDNNERLVVFVDDDAVANSADWMHSTYNWVVSTEEEVPNTNSFNCAYERGNAGNDLFMLNHYVSASIFGQSLGGASKDSAQAANSLTNLYAHGVSCEISKQRPVNFLVVDFYAQGDLMQTINIMNGVEESPF